MSHYLVITWTLLLILALHTSISWFPSFGVNYQSDSTSELLSHSQIQESMTATTRSKLNIICMLRILLQERNSAKLNIVSLLYV